MLLAHPYYEASRVNRALSHAAAGLPEVTVRDLYEQYPEQLIDADTEQALVDAHDAIVFQHPLYWYSCPALMKNWIDTVLTRGWAYGPGGTALRGKLWLQAISSGGNSSVYQRDGNNRFTMAELLRPFEQTARLCDMHFLHPFLTQAAGTLDDSLLLQQAEDYRALLQAVVDGEVPQRVHSLEAEQAHFTGSGFDHD